MQIHQNTEMIDFNSFSLIVFEIVMNQIPFQNISSKNQLFNKIIAQCSIKKFLLHIRNLLKDVVRRIQFKGQHLENDNHFMTENAQ